MNTRTASTTTRRISDMDARISDMDARISDMHAGIRVGGRGRASEAEKQGKDK